MWGLGKSCRGTLTKQMIATSETWWRQADHNMSSAEQSTVLVVPVECAQKMRFELEKLQLWDATHKLQKLADSDQVAIPIIVNGKNISLIADKWPDFRVARTCLPVSKKVKVKQSNPAARLQDKVLQLLTLYGMSEELLSEVPSKWERHGDLVIIPAHTFTSPEWAAIGNHLWEVVAKCLTCQRLARHSAIANNGFRSSRVVMLLGQNGEVTHVDNGIRYTYDVTKCMFSPGNITEKLRVANLDCTNETVVDLYAGIGYFTLPYLVHARACHVHACEWNPDAVIALKRNLLLNGVAERCTIHEGDNRMLQLPPLADRVNLGLIPSSEDGWPVAVQVLRLSGGILHVHSNVTTFHHRRAPDVKTEDLHDESRQIDAKNEPVSGRGSWQLHPSRQTGEDNVLITDNENGDLSRCFLEETAMNSAVVGQGVKDGVTDNERSFLESCRDFRESSGIVDHSDSFLCAPDDVTAQPEDCSLYPLHESLQTMSQKWQQASSETTSQLSEFKNVASDGETNVHSEDNIDEYNTSSKDSCKATLLTCTDYTNDNDMDKNDNELDKTSQKRTGKNIFFACEQWSLCVQRQIKYLLETKKGGTWTVARLHLEIVKSYAPHIVHVVLDLECRPA